MEHREESESQAGNTPSAPHNEAHDVEKVEMHSDEVSHDAAPASEIRDAVVHTPLVTTSSEVLALPPASFFARNKSTIIAACIALIIFAGAGGYYWHQNVYMVDGPVIAVVNGEKIYAAEKARRISFLENNALQQGQDIQSEEVKKLIDTQAMDMLINDALLLTSARAKGHSADLAKVDTEIETLITSAGGSEGFQEQLTNFGITEKEIRANIGKRLITEAYLEKETEYSSITVTEEEVNAFYKDVKAQNKDTPPLKDIKDQVQTYLLQQKQQEFLTTHLATLKETAKITIKEEK